MTVSIGRAGKCISETGVTDREPPDKPQMMRANLYFTPRLEPGHPPAKSIFPALNGENLDKIAKHYII